MLSDAQLAAASYSCGVVGAALLAWQVLGPSAPEPPPLPPPGPPVAASPRPASFTTASALGRSAPLEVSIPAIDVRAAVSPMDRDVSGAAEVPPLSEPDMVGWYAPGPAPGQRGPAVLYGHADSRESGPAVLHKLGELRPGDRVEVSRRDGRTASFTVDSVELAPKETFPADRVYGPANRPLLRLVTCGGRYSEEDGEYLDNIVAFATLTE